MAERRSIVALWGISAALLFAGGCVRRVVNVTSNPSGALVYLNDQEVGRTPMTRDIIWYGTYEVELRKEGYQTLKTKANVLPPVWNFIPLDLITDMLPVTDEHNLAFSLKPAAEPDAAAVVARATQMREELESSDRTQTRKPKVSAEK